MSPLAPFIGLPYTELVSAPGALDGCYGLVLRVYREAFGLELEVPASGAHSTTEIRDAEATLLRARDALDWLEVATGDGAGLRWSRPPRLFDVVYARPLGYPHVGLVASEDGLSMLHAYVSASSVPTEQATRAALSHVVRLDRRAWVRSLVAAYRHPRFA